MTMAMAMDGYSDGYSDRTGGGDDDNNDDAVRI